MEQVKRCAHIKIRDTNDYTFNAEEYIKDLERKYSIDVRSIPSWKELIKRLHVAKTDYNRIIQSSKARKLYIINKLHIEFYRPSPFELTEKLVRTAKKWDELKQITNKYNIKLKDTQIDEDEKVFEQKESKDTVAHSNTESGKSSVDLDEKTDSIKLESHTSRSIEDHLPIRISPNIHRCVSPIKTEDKLEVKNQTPRKKTVLKHEWKTLTPTNLVECIPKDIVISNHIGSQSVSFSISNFSNAYVFVQYKYLTNGSFYKLAKVSPVARVKIIPGLSSEFTLECKLLKEINDFDDYYTNIYFKVSHNPVANRPKQALLIPIKMQKITRSVNVSEIVQLPPAYPWHLTSKHGYPTAYLNLSVNDDFGYYIRVIKRKESKSELKPHITELSYELDTYSEIDRLCDIENGNEPKSIHLKKDYLPDITNTDFMASILNSIVEIALNPLWFKRNYMYLSPNSTSRIPVCLTKTEHIGFHQACYNIEFYDAITEQLIFTKMTRVFAEVLENPIVISPPHILDMRYSPVHHGFCIDYISIRNNHKALMCTVKIMLTSKMKKLIKITPLEISLTPNSCYKFKVMFCGRERDVLSNDKSDYLVHFTFKITLNGMKTVFENVPPIFYEIICPCYNEFLKVYKNGKSLEPIDAET